MSVDHQLQGNKVLLRLVDPGLVTSDVHTKASNYEVYLAKFHLQRGRYFYCNLIAKSTSWDAPVGAVEVIADINADTATVWKEVSEVYVEVSLAAEALEKAKEALRAAEQKKIDLLEGLRLRKSDPCPIFRDQVQVPPTSVQATRDSHKVLKRSISSQVAESDATRVISTDCSTSIAPQSASPRIAAPQNNLKIYVNWTHHKPAPDPALTSAQLRDAFNQYGAINSAFVVVDSLAKKSMPYGFVEFKSADCAERAVAMKNVSLGAVLAKVCYARGSN
jgi:hypothetical protein